MKGFAARTTGARRSTSTTSFRRRSSGRSGRPGRRPHLFNDLALDAAGNVYVTDTASTEILVLRAGAAELETLVPKDTFVAPNGIVASADGKHL